jgi:hypothetical protein
MITVLMAILALIILAVLCLFAAILPAAAARAIGLLERRRQARDGAAWLEWLDATELGPDAAEPDYEAARLRRDRNGSDKGGAG